MRNNPVNAASSTPSFQAMIDRINAVVTSDITELSNPRSVSPAMRLSLATFLEEWTESDVGHEKYIGNLLSGFEANEGIKMGDLLEWMAIGTDNQFDNEVSMPKGVDHKALVGLHAELLDFLPLKSYNTFTMVTLLEDDPELVEEVFNNYVELTATEHDALQALSTIVKRGSIESIRLLLKASPKHAENEKGYGFTQTDNYGSLLVDTFELCRRASVAYKDGNYMGAKALLGQLFDEKGIDAELVRMDIGKMAPMKLTIAGQGGQRGPGQLVLVSSVFGSLDKKEIISGKDSKEIATKAKEAVKVTILERKKEKIHNGNPSFEIQLYNYDEDESKNTDMVKVFGKSKEAAEDQMNKKLGKAGTSISELEKATEDGEEWYVELMGKHTRWDALSSKIGDADDDDDDVVVAIEAVEEDGKLDQADVLDLVRKFGNVSQEVKQDQNNNNNDNNNNRNNKKAKVVQVQAESIMRGIYGTLKQGLQAKFVIHAIIQGGTISHDLVPKGSVTFSVNEKTNKSGKGSHVNMVVEMLPGHESKGEALFRTEVDPINTAIDAAHPETRRNPSALECGKCGAQPEYDEITTVQKGAKHPFTGKMATSQVIIHAGCGGNLRGVMGPRNNPEPHSLEVLRLIDIEDIVMNGWYASEKELFQARYSLEQIGAKDHQTLYKSLNYLIESRFTTKENPWDPDTQSFSPADDNEGGDKSSKKKKDKAKRDRIPAVDVGLPRREQSMDISHQRSTPMEQWQRTVPIDNPPHPSPPASYIRKAKELGVYDDMSEFGDFIKWGNLAPAGQFNHRHANTYHIGTGWVIRTTKNVKAAAMKKSGLAEVKWIDPGDWRKPHRMMPPPPKQNPKGAGKKGKSSVGNTYAIDLIPRSSIKLTQKDIKYSNKMLHKWRDSSAEMKAFWKKYTATGSGGGDNIYVADKTFKIKWFSMKKGETWNSNRPPLNPETKDELKDFLISKGKIRGKWLRQQMNGLAKKGTLIIKPGTQAMKQTGKSYVTYKGGKVRMEMILARHKISGSMVPYRLLVPAAAFRMEGGTLIPRSGSADSKGAKQLIELIEGTFGKIKFHKNMGSGGLKVGRISLDEGVAKVFKTGGLYISDDFADSGAVARPYLYDDKRMTYIAKGRQYTMEIF